MHTSEKTVDINMPIIKLKIEIAKCSKIYLQENNMLCLNTHFQKRHGQLWTHNSPNDFKAQIDFIIINKKWKNSV